MDIMEKLLPTEDIKKKKTGNESTSLNEDSTKTEGQQNPLCTYHHGLQTTD